MNCAVREGWHGYLSSLLLLLSLPLPSICKRCCPASKLKSAHIVLACRGVGAGVVLADANSSSDLLRYGLVFLEPCELLRYAVVLLD